MVGWVRRRVEVMSEQRRCEAIRDDARWVTALVEQLIQRRRDTGRRCHQMIRRSCVARSMLARRCSRQDSRRHRSRSGTRTRPASRRPRAFAHTDYRLLLVELASGPRRFIDRRLCRFTPLRVVRLRGPSLTLATGSLDDRSRPQGFEQMSALALGSFRRSVIPLRQEHTELIAQDAQLLDALIQPLEALATVRPGIVPGLEGGSSPPLV